MTTTEFFAKFRSRYLWGNLIAMAVVALLLVGGCMVGIGLYTHHGESIAIPNLVHRRYADAERILRNAGLELEVSDTGYVKTLPPDCILAQSPAPGERVKGGRIVYVTINAPHTPTLTLPDIIDNSSLREAMAKLTAMGFMLTQPQFVPGEKDWVYGVLVNGRHVVAGDKIPVDARVTIQVGNGQRDAADSINYTDPIYPEDDESDIDEFEEVTEPPTEAEEPAPATHEEPAAPTQPAAPVHPSTPVHTEKEK